MNETKLSQENISPEGLSFTDGEIVTVFVAYLKILKIRLPIQLRLQPIHGIARQQLKILCFGLLK
jgi:hypothetical protein